MSCAPLWSSAAVQHESWELAAEDASPTEVESVAFTEIDVASTDIDSSDDSPAGVSGAVLTEVALSAGSGVPETAESASSTAGGPVACASSLVSSVGAGGDDAGEVMLPCASHPSSTYSYTATSSPAEDLWECPHCHHMVVPAYRCSYCLSTNSP